MALTFAGLHGILNEAPVKPVVFSMFRYLKKSGRNKESQHHSEALPPLVLAGINCREIDEAVMELSQSDIAYLVHHNLPIVPTKQL